MRRPTADVNIPSTSSDPNGLPFGTYDWSRFGRHRFRSPAAVVIDFPLVATADSWIATIWPDVHSATGWARMLWLPDVFVGRGWQICDRISLGDVIEFGSHSTESDDRWYGILDSYEVDAWLTLQGPYPHPQAAQQDADRLLAAERFRPPLLADDRRSAGRCSRHRQARHP